MKIRFVELAEPLREGGLEKAAADMAKYLETAGVEVIRGDKDPDLADVDLVHFHGLWSPRHYRAARQCRKRGIPCVISPHGMLEPWAWKHKRWKKWPYFHLVEKRRIRWANAILATASQEAENLRKHFPENRIEVLPLGIETDVLPAYRESRELLVWKDNERVLLYLSRIHPKKGLKELLIALVDLFRGQDVSKVRLVIVGDGPADYVGVCKALVEKLKPAMQIDWIEPQWGDGKWKYLRGADLFCLPTYSENFGIVVLEAGIVGTPIFTTTGTPWKVIEEHGFGWVPDPKLENYQRVLQQFLQMPIEEIQRMRAPLAEWTRTHFGWPAVINQYVHLYETILSRKV